VERLQPNAMGINCLHFKLSNSGSPAIVEAILDGQFPTHLTMKDLMEPFPMDWAAQREHFFSEEPVLAASEQL